MNRHCHIGQLLVESVENFQEKFAIAQVKNKEIHWTSFNDYLKKICQLSKKIQNISQGRSVKIALLSKTREEWNLLDLAISCSNNISVPIFQNYSAEDIEYIIQHSESEILIVEDMNTYKKIKDIDFGKIHTLVFIEQSETSSDKISLSYLDLINDFHSLTQEEIQEFKNSLRQIKDDSLATIVYTSGTTDLPKGAMITHKSILTMLDNLRQSLRGSLSEDDRSLIVLPLAHVLGRCNSYLNLIFGIENVYGQNGHKIFDELKLVSPTVFVGVPRFFEKLYHRIHQQIDSLPSVVQRAFEVSFQINDSYYHKIESDLAPASHEVLLKRFFHKFLYKEISQSFGGKIRFFVSGGAPLDENIARFMNYFNLTILEGYGLTETVAPCILNLPGRHKIGTVGVPIGDVQVKIADDSEIMIRSKSLFSGYYKDENSKDSFQGDHFLTGDLGKIDSQGFVKIIGRKKDLIVTSSGKNISPQKIEKLMANSPLIAHVIPIGDRRNFVSAIVAIEKSDFIDFFDELNLKRNCSHRELSSHPKVHKMIQSEIEKNNLRLNRFEAIKRFFIADRELSVKNGLLTPSLKVKRQNVIALYQEQIEQLYSEANFDNF